MSFSDKERPARHYYNAQVAAPLHRVIRSSKLIPSELHALELQRQVREAAPSDEHATEFSIDLELTSGYPPGLQLRETVNLTPHFQRSDFLYNWAMRYGEDQRWSFASPEPNHCNEPHCHKRGGIPIPLTDESISDPESRVHLVMEFFEWLARHAQQP